MIGKRVHLAVIFEQRGLRLYVDGKQQKSSRAIEEFIPSPYKFMLGGNPTYVAGEAKPSADYCFQGTLDEIRISRVARYAEDFQPQPRFTPDPQTLLLYHCDEGSGEVLKDSSGRNNHGTIFGTQWVPVAAE